LSLAGEQVGALTLALLPLVFMVKEVLAQRKTRKAQQKSAEVSRSQKSAEQIRSAAEQSDETEFDNPLT
jgi:hypothetical protein